MRISWCILLISSTLMIRADQVFSLARTVIYCARAQEVAKDSDYWRKNFEEELFKNTGKPGRLRKASFNSQTLISDVQSVLRGNKTAVTAAVEPGPHDTVHLVHEYTTHTPAQTGNAYETSVCRVYYLLTNRSDLLK